MQRTPNVTVNDPLFLLGLHSDGDLDGDEEEEGEEEGDGV